MAKSAAPKPTLLTPSWRLLPASIELCRTHIYSLFWLVLIPAVMNASAVFVLNQAIRKTGKDVATLTTTQLDHLFTQGEGRYAVLLFLISLIWLALVYPATILLATRGVRGGGDQPFVWLKQSMHYFWRLYGLALIIGIIVVAGLIAFIIPGIFLYRRYALAPYYLVEQDTGIRAALRLSAQQSRPERNALWGVLGVTLAMSLAASVVADLPLIGLLLGPIVRLLYYFGLPLRQKEISDRHAIAA